MLVPWTFGYEGGARGMGVVGAGLGPAIAAAAAATAVVGDGDGDGEGYGEGYGGGRGEGKGGDENGEGSGVERALEGSVSWAEGVESPAAAELVPVVARRADSFLVIWASFRCLTISRARPGARGGRLGWAGRSGLSCGSVVKVWARYEAILQRLGRGFGVLDLECWIWGLEG